jgi:transposase
MPRPYHSDLRSRAIQMLNNGTSSREVSSLLGLGIATVNLWRRIWKKEGRVEGLTGYQKGHSHKITDNEKFEAFILAHPTKTQKELGKLWEFPCSDATINKGLKMIGYTYKKRI